MQALTGLRTQLVHTQWELKKELHSLVIALIEKINQAQECIKKQTLTTANLIQLDLSNLKSTTKTLAQERMMLVKKKLKILQELTPWAMKKELHNLVTALMDKICPAQACTKKLTLPQ